MKKITLLLFLVFICGTCFSQEKQIRDTAYLECTYRYLYCRDTTAQKIKYQKDESMTLQIGKFGSRFYSANQERHYNEFLEMMESQPKEENHVHIDMRGVSPGGEEFEVYKLYDKNTIIFRDDVGTSYFEYEEPTEQIEWQILDSTKQILNYSCRKAECFFRGRQYEAWFTDEVSVSEGPYKFTGLPGLIVLIHDVKKHYSFELVGVKKVSKPMKFVKNKKYTQISREKYSIIKRKSNTDPIGFITSSIAGLISISTSDGQPITPKKYYYDLIERDL